MTDTPETDLAVRGSNGQWSFGLRDLCQSLERQRNAYAETLRVIASTNERSHHEAAFAALIRERHPELVTASPTAARDGEKINNFLDGAGFPF